MTSKIENIGILGATGYIGSTIAVFLLKEKKCKNLHLFSRDISNFDLLKTQIVVRNLESEPVIFHNNKDIYNIRLDLIINCAGLGKPVKIRKHPDEVFSAIEQIDDILFDYLKAFPNTQIVSLSSGSVYGQGAQSLESRFPCNNIVDKYYYPIVKLYSEVKHRSWSSYHVADIRVYAFASEFIDLDAGFFMGEMIKSVITNTKFIVSPTDMIRDYIGVEDLYQLIEIIYKTKTNDVYDIFSIKPVSKFELLDRLMSKDILTYSIDTNIKNNPTGSTDIYAPISRKAADIGYKPKYSSCEILEKILSSLSIINKED